jgi:hypothetical protein
VTTIRRTLDHFSPATSTHCGCSPFAFGQHRTALIPATAEWTARSVVSPSCADYLWAHRDSVASTAVVSSIAGLLDGYGW